jgi:hypothetical protein
VRHRAPLSEDVVEQGEDLLLVAGLVVADREAHGLRA